MPNIKVSVEFVPDPVTGNNVVSFPAVGGTLALAQMPVGTNGYALQTIGGAVVWAALPSTTVVAAGTGITVSLSGSTYTVAVDSTIATKTYADSAASSALSTAEAYTDSLASFAALTYATKTSLTGTGYLKGTGGFVGFVTTVLVSELSTGSTGVLKGNGTGVTVSTVVDADVSANAAIAGTKISPDFGSQTVLTQGIFEIKSSGTSTGADSGKSGEIAIATDVSTTGGGTTTIYTFTPSTDGVFTLELRVRAVRSDATAGYSAGLVAQYRKNGASIVNVLDGVPLVPTGTLGVSAATSVSGSTVIVTVTDTVGTSGNPVRWNVMGTVGWRTTAA